MKTMNVSFNFSYSVVETNREILYEAKAYESVSLSLTDFAESRESQNHVFICYAIFCNECLLSCASPQSTVLVQNLSFIFISHYENEIFVSRRAN